MNACRDIVDIWQGARYRASYNPGVRLHHAPATHSSLSSLHVPLLTVGRLGEVHIRVSEGAPGDHVSTYPNGEHRSGGAEFLVQHSLRDIGVQVADVERSHRIAPGRRVHASDSTETMWTTLPSKK